MPNAPVPAAAGGMPKFNRSEIMKAAWAHYRRAQAYVASNPYLRGTLVRFGDCLKAEWKRAKAQVAKAKLDAAVVARIDALKAEILTLDCKPFGMRIGAERRALVVELAKLEAA
ncbi:hypothetical protein GCM10023069_25980 [Shinella granuli]|uniref:Uncharacterized protein n=3 Tax=Shinella granuli TaxID=323621 RepID=A0A4R2C3K9_SHIGR|nr:hypothetical protein EV665_13116 [Shinella granuli]